MIAGLDKRTLAMRRRIAIPDYLGCVMASLSTLVVGKQDSRRLPVFSKRGQQLLAIDNPSCNLFQAPSRLFNSMGRDKMRQRIGRASPSAGIES